MVASVARRCIIAGYNNEQGPCDVAAAMFLGRSDRADIETRLASVAAPTSVIVRDVGQGRFVTLSADLDVPLMHFDAGWPVPFNRATEPADFVCSSVDVPVLLSHWDFDHLLSFYRFPLMQARTWIVPAQRVGPGAARIAMKLASNNRLLVWSGDPIKFPGGEVSQCLGHPTRTNDSGLTLNVHLKSGGKVLLIGDAGYDQAQLLPAYDALVVTHHGARFSGTAPVPVAKRNRAALSVGKDNRYKHPHAEALTAYKSAGWTVLATSGGPVAVRGDVRLP